MIGRRAALLEHLDVAAGLLGHADQHEKEVVAPSRGPNNCT